MDFDAKESTKFAAIDIGSNAVRLLLSRVFDRDGEPFIKKEALVRIPIRLGEDVFTINRVSDNKITRLLQTIQAFKLLIESYQPADYLACATSAMREAENGDFVVKEIKEATGLNLEIINGKREAEIIFSNRIEKKLVPNQPYLYIDVGGGSTELSLFTSEGIRASMSFKIGTVRLLKQKVKEMAWQDMKSWIFETTKGVPQPIAIGSGGNINKIFRIANKKEGKPISYKQIRLIEKDLQNYSYEDRIKVLGLRPDRADVILPAAEIYLSAMKWAKCEKMFVPQVGLADGLVNIMYQDFLKKKFKNN